MENVRWVLLVCLFFIFTELQSCSGFDLRSSSEEREVDRVNELPGQSFNVDFAHYSGYVTVSEGHGRSLFYWLIEATGNASSKPLVLWLNGGPGCSSIGNGEAMEIGPFQVNSDGKTLHLSNYSWNQVANLLFIDTPVGTGYSYSNDSQDVLNNGDEKTAIDSLEFLLKWLERFPEYKGREFYITGESYAGHYIPQLAQAIVKYQAVTGDYSINLKGLMVGNGLADDYLNHLGSFQYMWTNGFISDATFNLLNTFCLFESYQHITPRCQKILDIATDELGNIDQYSVFTPSCINSAASSTKLLKRMKVGRIGEQYDPCTEDYTTVYFNLPEVQKALHANPAVAQSKWKACNDFVDKNWKDSATSVLPIYPYLIHLGLRIWMISGDTDSLAPVTSTRYTINALMLPIVTPWRAWYDHGQLGGWTQGYLGLNFVSVRGAGHDIPMYKPDLAFAVIKAFLSGTSMPGPSEHGDS
ncbi:hypothetical protein Scep_023549 [Stephania cephalantha]|uniref:Carboxypeptidase n=1 Tax=Stephania cephalantha TaxID=152367 RepID=A0AAP0F3V0_9MAGN